jgi:hypothetical protein
MASVLPAESFAELAAELVAIARDKAMAAEGAEIMVASIEAKGEQDIGGGVRHVGMRAAVAMLRRRALLAGRAADLLMALAAREADVRALLGDSNNSGASPQSCPPLTSR